VSSVVSLVTRRYSTFSHTISDGSWLSLHSALLVDKISTINLTAGQATVTQNSPFLSRNWSCALPLLFQSHVHMLISSHLISFEPNRSELHSGSFQVPFSL